MRTLADYSDAVQSQQQMQQGRRKMRKTYKWFIWLSLVVWLVASTGLASAYPIVAFQSTDPGNQSFAGRLGTNFDVGSSPIVVSALGVFDDPTSEGLVNTILVGLFNRSDSGSLISGTSIGIGPGTPGTVIGNFRFVDIDPIVLPANFLGAVVAVGFSDSDPNGNTNMGGWSVIPDTGGGLISLPSPTGFYDTNTTLGTDLAGVIPGDWQFGGASFEYEAASVSEPNAVPEPSTLLLLGSGLVGLAGAGWRRHYRK